MTSFMLLAFLFVPVLFPVGSQFLMSPMCYAAYDYVTAGIFVSPGAMLKEGGAAWQLDTPLLFYLCLFLIFAFVSFRISKLTSEKEVQICIQVGFLVLLFIFSFLPLIGESDWNPGGKGESGCYNFWTACLRFPETTRR
jgi:hypothetical protein